MCEFCDNLNKKLILLESEWSLVLANYFPMSKGNLLVIPKRHIYSITELSDVEAADIIKVLSLAANNLKFGFKPDGVSIFANEGEVSGQTIPHLHFHIIARTFGDGLKNFERNGDKKAISDEELKLIKDLF